MQSLATIIIDHLQKKFPQYQFEYSIAGTTGPPKYNAKDVIKFYCHHDYHSRIELVFTECEPTVELWGYRPPSGNMNYFDPDRCGVAVRVHRFSLAEPDSLLWIERFIMAGRKRLITDLTKPVLPATDSCDNGQERSD